jgi:hypothetical protein
MFSSCNEAIDWLNTYVLTNLKNEWIDPFDRGEIIKPYRISHGWSIGRTHLWINNVEELAGVSQHEN